ncbi:MAG: hypothetical protein ACRDO8_09185 [Nocardioidaceae bacterium]
MIAALRYEWVRLTTIRSTYWLLGATLVLYLALTLTVGFSIDDSEVGSLVDGRQTLAAMLTVGASAGIAPLLLAYIIGIIGVFSMGHEYRHGMIRATLTAVPNRFAVLAAKLVSIAVVAIVGSVLTMLVGIFSVLVVGLDLPIASGFTAELVLGVVLYAILFSWVGVALAGLIRHQTAAVALLILLPTVIESILRALLRLRQLLSDHPDRPDAIANLANFLPFDAGGKMYTRASVADLISIGGAEPFGPVGGGIVMAVFVALLLAGMTYLFVRRDA